MAKTNKIVYVTEAQYASLITDGYVVVGGVTYNYDANNTYMVQENGLVGTDVQSTGVTSGKVSNGWNRQISYKVCKYCIRIIKKI